MTGAGATVHISDFRMFTNRLHRMEKGVYASVNDEGMKEAIYRGIAMQGDAFANSRGTDTGATDLSIDSLKDGKGAITPIERTNDKGTIRYAHSEVSEDGILVDPFDSSGHHYGQYVVETFVSDFDLRYDDELRNEIYKIVKEHLEKGR